MTASAASILASMHLKSCGWSTVFKIFPMAMASATAVCADGMGLSRTCSWYAPNDFFPTMSGKNDGKTSRKSTKNIFVGKERPCLWFSNVTIRESYRLLLNPPSMTGVETSSSRMESISLCHLCPTSFQGACRCKNSFFKPCMVDTDFDTHSMGLT